MSPNLLTPPPMCTTEYVEFRSNVPTAAESNALRRHRDLCARMGLPVITIRKATYWIVEIASGTLPVRRFEQQDIETMVLMARDALMNSPSPCPGIYADQSPFAVYGLSQVCARSFARSVYQMYWERLIPPHMAQSATDTRVVSLAAERRKRRTSADTSDPWQGGPA